ncbi:uncharacterized protein (TIGR00162 family) [Methanococcus voltae]|uniref:Uncharacterized protein (TIGR00162 family) n=2 Tax=Methanococcus voltae TaxID=2188 RepID=A0A8J7S1R7_METVO|nr:proteasome assembly chaperone family protein [Methanococcus voltae]MBP2201785.1 uncharacterized protein (TIGR00162 family) [Methanococcus voltae]MCS3922609.1 uncharacterized protein (TIGR00162 family) [Methanococcus voltae PS]
MINLFEKKIKEHEPLKDAVLIEGLPGIGHVGRIAAEHLIDEFNGEKVMEIYCSDFPPQVNVKPDGSVEFMSNDIYLIEEPIPMVIIVGNTQSLSPAGQYEVSKRLMELGIEYGATKTYTLGGLGIGQIPTEDLKVYVASTSAEIAEQHKEYGVEFRDDNGSILGAAGLMLMFSKLNNIEATCLMAETIGYVVDPKASTNVLNVLSKALGFEVDSKKLEQRALEVEKLLEKVQLTQEESELSNENDDLSYFG